MRAGASRLLLGGWVVRPCSRAASAGEVAATAASASGDGAVQTCAACMLNATPLHQQQGTMQHTGTGMPHHGQLPPAWVITRQLHPPSTNSHGLQQEPLQPSASGTAQQQHGRRCFSTAPVLKTPQQRVTAQVQATPVQLETGVMAVQADGACLASSGSTHVLATAVSDAASTASTDDIDGVPLQVDYTEGAYARGQVPNLGRRDRMTDEQVLCARAIDRAIRPLFPPGFCQETHVCARVLSAGGPMDPEVLAINAASAALMTSDIPWAGPVGAVSIIRVDGTFQVGSAEPQQLGPGPAWARAAAAREAAGAEGLVQRDAIRDDFKLLYAGTADKVMMMELEADQVTEEELREALQLAQQHVASLVQAQLELAERAGKRKRKVQLLGATPEAERLVMEEARMPLEALFRTPELDKAGRARQVERVKAQVFAALKDRGLIADAASVGAANEQPQVAPQAISASEFAFAFETVLSDCMRQLVLDKGQRVDGRGLTQIRPLGCDALPLYPSKVHGSAFFARGETHTLALATVGQVVPNSPWQALLEAQEDDAVFAGSLEQAGSARSEAGAAAAAAGAPSADTDGVDAEDGAKPRTPLLLHYEFPPYCVNEVGKISSQPSRREVGHGALALKALRPLMPDLEDFSFLVRLVAQTLSSNGSSSMAAVCSGSMALQMAGVPVREPAAGISVGLMSQHWPRPRAGLGRASSALDVGNSSSDAAQAPYGRQALLLDIQGMEDALGDMDLKVAGTRNGITAVQLDTKLPGLQLELLCQAISVARQGHAQLLDVMQVALKEGQARRAAQPGAAIPQHAVHHIAEDLVDVLVGPGGSAVTALRERTGTAITVRPTGEVQIYAPSAPALELALQGVRALEGTDLEEGVVYLARVHEVLDYGAVVEMASGARHLLPISEVSHTKLRDIRDALFEGQVLKVKCLGRDSKGLVRLSYKVLQPVQPEAEAPAPAPSAKHQLGRLRQQHAHPQDTSGGATAEGDGAKQAHVQAKGQSRQGRQAHGQGSRPATGAEKPAGSDKAASAGAEKAAA